MEQRFIESMQQFGEVAYWLHRSFRGQGVRLDATGEQILRLIAIPIVGLIALLIGLLWACSRRISSGSSARPSSSPTWWGSSTRLGPWQTAIVVAGRSRSAVAAELGTMVVSEELDALRTMGLNPMRYLIVPRILAMTICVPILAAIANLIATSGA